MSIHKLYGDQIVQLRRDGYTLQEIGDRFGVTKEEIRRILGKLHFDSSLMTTLGMASELGISDYRFHGMCHKLDIRPVRTSPGGWVFWNKNILPIIRDALKVKCRICGKTIPIDRRTFCSDQCQLESYKYRNRSPEAKRAHSEATMRWRKENPERAKEIQKRADQRRYEKMKVIQ